MFIFGIIFSGSFQAIFLILPFERITGYLMDDKLSKSMRKRLIKKEKLPDGFKLIYNPGIERLELRGQVTLDIVRTQRRLNKVIESENIYRDSIAHYFDNYFYLYDENPKSDLVLNIRSSIRLYEELSLKYKDFNKSVESTLFSLESLIAAQNKWVSEVLKRKKDDNSKELNADSHNNDEDIIHKFDSQSIGYYINYFESYLNYKKEDLVINSRLINNLKRLNANFWEDQKTQKSKVFGIPLDLLCKSQNRIVPRILVDCCEWIKKYGLETKMIFRLSPTKSDVDELKELIDQGIRYNFPPTTNTHVVCGLLRRFLQELPEGVIPDSEIKNFFGVVKNNEINKEDLKVLLNDLPVYNYFTLQHLTELFHLISLNEEKNKMSASSLAIVISPNLINCFDSPESAENLKSNLNSAIMVFEHIFTHYKSYFYPKALLCGLANKITDNNSDIKSSHELFLIVPQQDASVESPSFGEQSQGSFMKNMYPERLYRKVSGSSIKFPLSAKSSSNNFPIIESIKKSRSFRASEIIMGSSNNNNNNSDDNDKSYLQFHKEDPLPNELNLESSPTKFEKNSAKVAFKGSLDIDSCTSSDSNLNSPENSKFGLKFSTPKQLVLDNQYSQFSPTIKREFDSPIEKTNTIQDTQHPVELFLKTKEFIMSILDSPATYFGDPVIGLKIVFLEGFTSGIKAQIRGIFNVIKLVEDHFFNKNVLPLYESTQLRECLINIKQEIKIIILTIRDIQSNELKSTNLLYIFNSFADQIWKFWLIILHSFKASIQRELENYSENFNLIDEDSSPSSEFFYSEIKKVAILRSSIEMDCFAAIIILVKTEEIWEKMDKINNSPYSYRDLWKEITNTWEYSSALAIPSNLMDEGSLENYLLYAILLWVGTPSEEDPEYMSEEELMYRDEEKRYWLKFESLFKNLIKLINEWRNKIWKNQVEALLSIKKIKKYFMNIICCLEDRKLDRGSVNIIRACTIGLKLKIFELELLVCLDLNSTNTILALLSTTIYFVVLLQIAVFPQMRRWNFRTGAED